MSEKPRWLDPAAHAPTHLRRLLVPNLPSDPDGEVEARVAERLRGSIDAIEAERRRKAAGE